MRHGVWTLLGLAILGVPSSGALVMEVGDPAPPSDAVQAPSEFVFEVATQVEPTDACAPLVDFAVVATSSSNETQVGVDPATGSMGPVLPNLPRFLSAVTVTVDADAAAFEGWAIHFDATASPCGPMLEATASLDVPFSTDFRTGLNVTGPASPVQATSGEATMVELFLVNQANGQANVRYDLDLPADVSAEFGGLSVLGPGMSRRIVANVTPEKPGQHEITFVFNQTSTQTGPGLASLRVTVPLTIDAAAQTPAPPLVVVVVAAGLAFALLRRRGRTGDVRPRSRI